MDNKLNIGKKIRRQLEKQQHSVAWLAEEIGHDYSNLCKQLKCRYVHPDLLLDISDAMNTDFFVYYSQCHYKRKYGKNYHIEKKDIKISEIHIGELIKHQVMIRGLTVPEFAKSIGRTDRCIQYIFKEKGINTELLREISAVLAYDFFQYYRRDDGRDLP